MPPPPRARDPEDNDDHDPEGPDPADQDADDSDAGDDTEPCPHCGAAVYPDSEWCPHCGKFLSREDEPVGVATWITAGVIIVLIVVFLITR